MDLDGIMLIEINQVEKDKYPMISLFFFFKSKLEERDWWLLWASVEGWAKQMNVVKRYKLPIIK